MKRSKDADIIFKSQMEYQKRESLKKISEIFVFQNLDGCILDVKEYNIK
jgi:hypothetical protein